MKVLITGATGFVGINTVKKLSRVHDVSVFVRNRKLAEGYFQDTVKIKLGDVRDIESLKRAFNDKFDAVLHIAGVISAHNLEKLYQVNRFGCKNVAQVAKERGVCNFVYVSSLAARGPDGVWHPISHYGNSKRLGELEIINSFGDKNLKIIRPPIIFGPHDRGTFPLFKLASLGVYPIIDRVYSFLYVEKLSEILKGLLEYRTEKLEFFYASSFTVAFTELAACLKRVSGKKGFKLKLPLSLIKLAAHFSTKSSPFTKDKVREIEPEAWSCDSKTVESSLNIEPSVDMCEAIKETFDWYRTNGWL